MSARDLTTSEGIAALGRRKAEQWNGTFMSLWLDGEVFEEIVPADAAVAAIFEPVFAEWWRSEGHKLVEGGDPDRPPEHRFGSFPGGACRTVFLPQRPQTNHSPSRC